MFMVLFTCMALPLALATEPTQQYNKISFTPFYMVSLPKNINYTFYANIPSFPSGLTNVTSSIVTFQIYATSTVQDIYLWVNNAPCNNAIFQATSSGLTYASFDCANVINQSGNYTLKIFSAKDAGSAIGWIDLTYINKPKGTIELFGTEYTSGQIAKVWLQLLDANRTYINNGVCFVDVYAPVNGMSLTNYIEGAVMTNYNHDGIYYYDINPVPNSEGVYPTIAKCYYSAGITPNYGTTIQMLNGSINTGSLANTQILDGSYMTTTESPLGGGNPRRYWSEINFSTGNICSNISESLLSGIVFDWTGRWNSNLDEDVITISVYNYTSSTWINLPNTITGAGSGSKTVSNSIALTNMTKAGLVNDSGTNLRLKFTDTSLNDTSSSSFDYDYLSVGCNQFLTSIYEEIKGSSEIHVTATNTIVNETSIANTIWNYFDRNLTYYPPVTINTTEISNAVWNYSGTVSPTLLTQISNAVSVAVWDYFNSTKNFISLITESIWTRTDRNLTYYNTTNINYTLIGDNVWNFINRNLTYYNTSLDINYTLVGETVWSYVDRNLTYYNTTDVNYTLIGELVWAYANRNLTYYPNNTDVNYTLVGETVWNYLDRNLTFYNMTDINYSMINEGVWNFDYRYTHGELAS